jgi:hypothetical protein
MILNENKMFIHKLRTIVIIIKSNIKINGFSFIVIIKNVDWSSNKPTFLQLLTFYLFYYKFLKEWVSIQNFID